MELRSLDDEFVVAIAKCGGEIEELSYMIITVVQQCLPIVIHNGGRWFGMKIQLI